MKPDLSVYSKTELCRIYRKISNHIDKVDGYQPYGHDWTTLWIVWPQSTEMLIAIRREYCERYSGVSIK